MDTAYFVSDGGSLYYLYNECWRYYRFRFIKLQIQILITNLLVSSIVSSNQAIIESIEISSGLVLGLLIFQII